MRLTDRILRLHEHLSAAGLPHAFGGALALAFCTLDPRGTDDIDVNIFAGTRRIDDVIAALPDSIDVAPAQQRQLRRDGQTRLTWDRTPVDIFLSNHPFHGRAELQTRTRPFAGVDLPVLACIDLAVFKVMFARPKDAVDIAEMIKARCVDLDDLTDLVAGLIDDERDDFLSIVRRFAEDAD